MLRKPYLAWLAAALLACGPGRGEEVSFLASDAVRVGGRLVGSGPAAVLVLPSGAQASWHTFAERLAEEVPATTLAGSEVTDDILSFLGDVLENR